MKKYNKIIQINSNTWIEAKKNDTRTDKEIYLHNIKKLKLYKKSSFLDLQKNDLFFNNLKSDKIFKLVEYNMFKGLIKYRFIQLQEPLISGFITTLTEENAEEKNIYIINK
jgi:hypothetical protein